MSTAIDHPMISPTAKDKEDRRKENTMKQNTQQVEGCEEAEHSTPAISFWKSNFFTGLVSLIAGAVIVALVGYFALFKSPLADSVDTIEAAVTQIGETVESNQNKLDNLTTAFTVLVPELEIDNEAREKIVEELLKTLTSSN